MDTDKIVMAVVVAVVLIAATILFAPAAHNADFYECEPNNTLMICPVGEVPAAECRNVGSGVVAVEPTACS